MTCGQFLGRKLIVFGHQQSFAKGRESGKREEKQIESKALSVALGTEILRRRCRRMQLALILSYPLW